jgi:phosphoribosylformylglycinamidine synthase subunit PurL
VPRIGFAELGHAIALVGPFEPRLEGSELEKLHGRLATSLADVDLAEQARALEALREAVRGGELLTVHDIADGGVAVAVAECCIAGGLGARLELEEPDDHRLFGEGPGGVVIAGPQEAVRRVPGAVVIGSVAGDSLKVGNAFAVSVDELRDAYECAIPSAFLAT